MGELGGFLKLHRVNYQYRPVDERLHDFKEYIQPLPEEGMREQGARCMDCGIPFCHSGCPLGNIIPDWNDAVYRGRWDEALAISRQTNHFPEFTGRICPAPCEAACVLDINDDPVTIKMIEQAISDRAWAEGWIRPRPPAVRSGKKVAVVGSGPAGMAAAAELNQFGHEVTLFERNDKIGGLLRYGIPDFKLEKWIVDRRVDLMAAEGIKFKTGVDVGVDITGDELMEQFDAVVLAIGSTVPRDLPVPGRELDGVHFAMEYLELRNRWVAGEFGDGDTPISAAGKHVVIIGGGDTGADCLGNSHRQQPASITQFEVMPEPPLDRPDDITPWPRWPLILRTSGAHQEGGERRFSVMTTELAGEGGKVKALRGHEVGPPPSFDKIEGSEFEIPADLVLLAMGFLHPQEDLPKALGLEVDGRGNVLDTDWQTTRNGVFACGDARRGQSLVVWAISEGRDCARRVDRWFAEEEAGGELDLVALAS